MTASAFAANGAVITLTQKWPNQLAKNSGSRYSRLSKPVSRKAVKTRTISSAQRTVQLCPRTSAFGAALWTGYLGGAVAIHVQQGHALWTHTLFPIYFAVMLWGGLGLRDRRVRALLR